MAKIKEEHNNEHFRFFKYGRNNKPAHPAYDLVEEYHDKQPNGTWKHKVTKLFFHVDGKPYVGEPGNYRHDNKEFLDFLSKQPNDYVYGIIGIHKSLSKLYGSEVIAKMGEKKSSISAQLNLKTYDNYFKKLKHNKNNYHVENLIWKNSITMFYADTENLKSMLAVIYLGMCVSSGKPFLELKTQKCPVLILNKENDDFDIRDRMEGIFRGHPEFKRKKMPLYFLMHEGDLTSTEFRTRLFADVMNKKIKLVIFDPIRQFGKFKEDKSDDINELFLDVFQPLKQAGVSIIFTHHTGKGGDYRGSSVFKDILDSAYHLKTRGKSGETRREFYFNREKGRRGPGETKLCGEIQFFNFPPPRNIKENYIQIRRRAIAEFIEEKESKKNSKVAETKLKLLGLFKNPKQELRVVDMGRFLKKLNYDYGSNTTIRRAVEELIIEEEPMLEKVSYGKYRRTDLEAQQKLEVKEE